MALACAVSTKTPNGDIDIGGGKFVYVFGTITPSGSYATNGDTLDFTAMTKPLGCLGIPAQKGGVLPVPVQVSIFGVNGYGYGYVAGTTAANGKVKATTASNTELAAGAYPAGITGDTISFCAVFPRF